MDKQASGAAIAPSQFMRQLRPELYSDSTPRTEHRLNAEVLSHHLDTLTERNQTHDFELFCRKLCERTICPNLRPATGPEGGGDSKADTETAPVSDEIQQLTFVGLANSGSERWAFAFSAKKTWAQKARSDVAGIMATNRGYTKIFFVTSRAARAKDRARLEDDLSKEYGVPVTIHDRSWIVDEVIAKNRRDLAFNYLGIGEETTDATLGPSDYSRKQQLADIEQELADPSAFSGMKMQRATEALVAAKLARNLELPRIEVEGRFLRAVRLADEGGSYGQQLAARYESLWTAFWWFDDIQAVLDGYDAFEALVLSHASGSNVALLCNLAQLLFNAVMHYNLTPAQTQLEARITRLSSTLATLAAERDRPNSALEARVSLLTLEVNKAMLAGAPERLVPLWPQFAEVLVHAEGLGEFDAARLTNLIEVFGQVAGKDRGYRDLVDATSAFVTKRTGESQGALVLLKRASQLEFDENMEMIRLLGKATRLLSKKEYAEELAQAQAQLAIAYRSAGLLWAARASCTSAAATIFIDAEDGGELPSVVFPILMNTAWVVVELKHVPEVLQTVRVARGALKSLPFDDASVERATENLQHLDLVLACHFANIAPDDLSHLAALPDILMGLELLHSRSALLYRLGYESELRHEGWIPQDESAQDVAALFNQLAGQPAAEARWRPAIFNEGAAQAFVTSVLGVEIRVHHTPSDTSITVAEAIVGTIEAFFATAVELEAFGHVERFDIQVVESDDVQFEVKLDASHVAAVVRWPAGVFPTSTSAYGSFVSMLLQVAASVFVATCHTRSPRTAAARLFETDAAMERAGLIASLGLSRQRIYGGVARLSAWDELSPRRYDPTPDRPAVVAEVPAPSPTAIPGDPAQRPERPRITDHRDLRVRSVIDAHLWDSASWAGAAYPVFSGVALPVLALMFRDEGAAAAIFDRWRERFGAEDKNEAIHIGIVRHYSAAHPSHYGVVVTSKMEDAVNESQFATVVSRSLSVEPSDDKNLTTFLSHFEAAGSYLLVPMVFAPGAPPRKIPQRYLLKRELTVKEASDVGPYDPENMFLHPRGLGSA